MEIKITDEHKKTQQRRTAMSIVIAVTSMFAAGIIIWSDTHSLVGWVTGSGILWASAVWDQKIAAWAYPENAA